MTDERKNDAGSQDIDVQEVDGFRFHRGSALSIFESDRREDIVALVLALAIALGIYLLV